MTGPRRGTIGPMGTFSSKLPFDAKHPDVLALYCSDGRFTNAVEKLAEDLGHARIDTLTIPGGAALVELTSGNLGGIETVRAALTFLIQGHHTKHMLLVAHDGCGYYKHRFPYDSPAAMHRRQLADLKAADRWVRGNHAGVEVRSFFARGAEGRIHFDEVGEGGAA